MIRKILPLYFMSYVLFMFVLPIWGRQDYSREEVRRVISLIEKIQNEQKQNSRLRKVITSESELNSYFAYRIEVDKEEIMKKLSLKLFEDNYIEGMVFLDFKGQNLPKFLKPEMTVYFGATVETESAAARLKIKDLFLENQRIHPKVLDLIIFIASKINNTESSSIHDWYELPYGIRKVKIHKGYAEFFY